MSMNMNMSMSMSIIMSRTVLIESIKKRYRCNLYHDHYHDDSFVSDHDHDSFISDHGHDHDSFVSGRM